VGYIVMIQVYDVTIKSKSGSNETYRKKLLVISLVIVVLVGFLFVYVLLVDRGGSIHVKSEAELRKAIDDVPFDGSAVIILDKDISLIGTLVIPIGKDITLTSNQAVDFFKLIGATGVSIVSVETGGVLRLDTRLTKQAF
jgi:hypothetical protein